MEGLCLTQLPISPEAVRQTKHSHYFNSNQATAAVCFPALSSAPTMACAVHPARSASCLAEICSGLGFVIGEQILTLFLVVTMHCVVQHLDLVIWDHFMIF